MKIIEMLLGFALRLTETFIKLAIDLMAGLGRIAGSAISAGLASKSQRKAAPNVVPFQRKRRKKKWHRTLH